MEFCARSPLARPLMTTIGALAALVGAAVPSATLFANDGPAPFTVVETGKR